MSPLTPEALRAMADAKPSPHWEGQARQTLHWAADVLEAAQAVIDERQHKPREKPLSTSKQIEKQLRQNAEILLSPAYRPGQLPEAVIAGSLQMAADEIFKLRKIAAFVPARIYIDAKEQAGFPDHVRAV